MEKKFIKSYETPYAEVIYALSSSLILKNESRVPGSAEGTEEEEL